MFKDFLSQGLWDNWTVIEEYYWTRNHQDMAVFVVGLDLIIPVRNVIRGAAGNGGLEELVDRGRLASCFQPLPGQDSNARVGHGLDRVGTMV